MPGAGLPDEVMKASEDGVIVNTGHLNGLEPDVIDDQPQTPEPVEGIEGTPE